MKKILSLLNRTLRFSDSWVAPAAFLGARLFIGNIFWKSGMTKIPNMQSTISLFQSEYLPNWEKNSQHVLGMDLSWTVPNATLAAYMSAGAELSLPVFLVLGLMGRFAAAGLFIMTLTIETFIYPDTQEHLYWMMLLCLLITQGMGLYSADHWLRKKFLQSAG